MTRSKPASVPNDTAILVTRLLAAAGERGLPFSSFESTLKAIQGDMELLTAVSFSVYAGDVTYSSQLRNGLDEALAQDWVRFATGRLAATERGWRALVEMNAEPVRQECELLGRVAA